MTLTRKKFEQLIAKASQPRPKRVKKVKLKIRAGYTSKQTRSHTTVKTSVKRRGASPKENA